MPAVAGDGETGRRSSSRATGVANASARRRSTDATPFVYRAVSSSGREISGWIDPARKFPLRIKTEDGAVITAENIQDEPQPARLFEMPANFRKFDPQALIQQIKQSDVWVNQPPQ